MNLRFLGSKVFLFVCFFSVPVYSSSLVALNCSMDHVSLAYCMLMLLWNSSFDITDHTGWRDSVCSPRHQKQQAFLSLGVILIAVYTKWLSIKFALGSIIFTFTHKLPPLLLRSLLFNTELASANIGLCMLCKAHYK